MGDILRQIPGKVLALCGTFLAATVLGCLTFLAATGSDATNLIQIVNTVLNFATLGVAGSAVAVGASAAASSKTAAIQTNGALDGRIRSAVVTALEAQRTVDRSTGVTTTTIPLEGGESHG
jgi:hypothetical protein